MLRQLFEYHPVIGYRFIPDLKARVRHEGGGYLVRVNGSGFRCNHSFVAEKRRGIRRILLFGDSFTAGDGVSNDKRYGDLLEQKLPNVEVYNFGLPGTGTDQHYLAFQEYGIGIEHDLVIIAILVENIRRVAARYRYYYNENNEHVCYAKPYYELADERLILRNVPPAREPVRELALSKDERNAIDRVTGSPILRHLVFKIGRSPKLRRLVITSGLKDRIQKLIRYQPVRGYESPDNPAWRLMRRILEEWIRKDAGHVLLLPIPFYHYVMGISEPHYQARLGEVVSSTGCSFHDPLPDLLKYPREQRRRLFFERDGHLTSEGHAALAASLQPVLEKLLETPATSIVSNGLRKNSQQGRSTPQEAYP